ncbi:MAG: hypothetical protein Q7S87_08730 [Agitococcus sp.]|nr:hypothetical protein [Agitococcus sp.]MDO9176982.1 hypothetical protein [Agitococcus sp.]
MITQLLLILSVLIMGATSSLAAVPLSMPAREIVPAPTSRSSSQPEEGPAQSQSSASNLLVNPFSGKSIANEQIQQKLQAQLREEQLKQKNLAPVVSPAPEEKPSKPLTEKKLLVAQSAVAPCIPEKAKHKPQPPKKKLPPRVKPNKKVITEQPVTVEETVVCPKDCESAEIACEKSTPSQIRLLSLIDLGGAKLPSIDVDGGIMLEEQGVPDSIGMITVIDRSAGSVSKMVYVVGVDQATPFAPAPAARLASKPKE